MLEKLALVPARITPGSFPAGLLLLRHLRAGEPSGILGFLAMTSCQNPDLAPGDIAPCSQVSGCIQGNSLRSRVFPQPTAAENHTGRWLHERWCLQDGLSLGHQGSSHRLSHHSAWSSATQAT